MTTMPIDVASTIQLAIAPAFLLVGIGQFLGLAAGRLARVVDRARVIADNVPLDPGPEHDDCIFELRQLDRRMSVVNASILLGTMSMIAVCLVVAGLFVARVAAVDFTVAIVSAFIVAMALLVIGLLLFLVEVRLANKSIHVRSDLIGSGRK